MLLTCWSLFCIWSCVCFFVGFSASTSKQIARGMGVTSFAQSHPYWIIGAAPLWVSLWLVFSVIVTVFMIGAFGVYIACRIGEHPFFQGAYVYERALLNEVRKKTLTKEQEHAILLNQSGNAIPQYGMTRSKGKTYTRKLRGTWTAIHTKK